jgi:hypothetical protein
VEWGVHLQVEEGRCFRFVIVDDHYPVLVHYVQLIELILVERVDDRRVVVGVAVDELHFVNELIASVKHNFVQLSEHVHSFEEWDGSWEVVIEVELI